MIFKLLLFLNHRLASTTMFAQTSDGKTFRTISNHALGVTSLKPLDKQQKNALHEARQGKNIDLAEVQFSLQKVFYKY